MPLNIPGILVPFQLLLHPRLVIPTLIVKDIRQIDFGALKRAGYRGAVFDKDNCLTIPHDDRLVPELQEAWKGCRETFGEHNVLIVSNSAGTYLDAGGLQSESVSYHLSVPVLQHKAFKPAYSCISAIRKYFTTLPDPIKDNELIIVGDRIFTDVVIANRMRRQNYLSRTHKRHPAGPLSIWTTGVWKKESMMMRRMERGLVDAVKKWSIPPAGEPIRTAQFIKKPVVKPEELAKQSKLQMMLSRLRWPGK
ncbi:mitochondrial PGP phosphatase-domain-containing protein [Panaeolus papilionaceus]|nr:mitochondrial PGP phosphatase-domain-containing protein [Panaeolus papilionaceus]